ncbi:MAG: PQQ-binding-like beta-propeller repeat protein [Bacteroidales bacterium]|nr:PQQ-binding-like beta-propeller repeat protein [Bacteroidales bacterium]
MKFIITMLFLVPAFIFSALADGWNVGSGGKPSRHSQSSESGPEASVLLWQGGQPSVIAQQAVIDGDIVVMSRIFNLNDVLHGTVLVAHDLHTGDTLWTADLPVDFPSSDWRNRVSAIRGGVVYATRSGNTNYSFVYALDAGTGAVLWKSEETINESSTEGASFASDGDLIVGNFNSVMRIESTDGTTKWQTPRSCPTSNGQEVSVFENRCYYWEASPYGPKVGVMDIETGAYLFSSDALSGGIIQQLGLFVGPDGTVYAPRSMNNPVTDFLFALTDKGASFEIKWSVPIGYIPFSTAGTGPDGSVYTYSVSGEVIRLDPATGNVLNTSTGILSSTSSSPRMAIDANGYVFVTNGEFATGNFYSFNPDLSLRWNEPIQNVNVGGPAIGKNGTLIVCGVGTNVRAYQGSYSLIADFNADNTTVCEGETVNYEDNSSGNVVSWEWLFEGGTPSSSQQQNPSVVYNTAGIFDVTLTVYDGAGYATLTREDFILVNPLPAVSFSDLPDFCLDDPPYLLGEGSPAGGEYSGPGVMNGYFYPDIAGAGSHTLIYTYSDENGCENSASQTVWVEECTGIHDHSAPEVSVFPNPVTDQLNIRMSLPGPIHVKVLIYNSLGNIIGVPFAKPGQKGETVIRWKPAVSEPGICLVRVILGDTQEMNFKIFFR